MKVPAGHPFRKHSDNVREIKKGLTQIERIHRDCLRAGKVEAEQTIARIHAMLIGMLAEALLKKIISEPGGLNDQERKAIDRERSQLGKWKMAVDLSFRRHYLVLFHETVAVPSVPKEVAARADKIHSLLDVELCTVITDRNSIAHAQWKWIQNSNETAFIATAPPPLSFVALKARSDIIIKIGQIVQALNVSDKTFQRDFDEIYASIASTASRLSGSGQDEYVKVLKRTARAVV